MDKKEFLDKFSQLVEDSHVGILATVTGEGFPSMRYMTPILINGRPDAIYAVTSSTFQKVNDLNRSPKVSWLFTNNKTREIFSFRGHLNIIDAPRFKSEILEELGQSLETFWKLAEDPSELVCLETTLISGEYFNPKSAEKFQVKF